MKTDLKQCLADVVRHGNNLDLLLFAKIYLRNILSSLFSFLVYFAPPVVNET